MVPIGTSHLWWLRVRTHLSSASVHLSLLVGARGGIVEVFCLRIIRINALGQMVQSLLRREPSIWLLFLRVAITAVLFISGGTCGRGGQY